MAGNDAMSNWEKIRESASDVERLIVQKQYNLAMVKSRQTLEYMVKLLMARYHVDGADLSEAIDNLYRARVISKTTAEHYHKIRLIGNKAMHEGEDNATDANTAYHLLSQEMYTFASDFTPKGRGKAPREEEERSRRSGRSKKKTPRVAETIFLCMIPVLVVVLVVAVVNLLKPKKSEPKEPETTMQIAMETTAEVIPETIPEETMPPETEPEMRWVATDVLNVRKEPSTEAEKAGQLQPGDEVDYIEDLDDFWAKIRYNGADAYVARQYLKQEAVTEGSGT